MAKEKGNLEVKHFVSQAGQNQYLLISGNEAATIDVSGALMSPGQLKALVT